jgi:hypothetical protein
MLLKIKFILYLACTIAWGVSAINVTEIGGKIVCTACALIWAVLMVAVISKMF